MASKHKHMAPHPKGNRASNHAHAGTAKLGGKMPGVMHMHGAKSSHGAHHAEHCKPAHHRRGK